MLKPLFLVDIDGNLGQSKKLSPQDVPLTVMSVDLEDKPNTFMSPSQLAFFQWLSASGNVVPCTARNSGGTLDRMRIPFTHHAIVSFGGAILLPDHSPEPGWKQHIDANAALCADSLCQIHNFILEEAKAQEVAISSSIKSELGTKMFLEVKHRGTDRSELDHFERLLVEMAPQGWTRHRNDNTLAILPPYIGKDKAAQYYVEKIAEPALFIIGMGDSLTDLPFMESACSYALMPTRSQAFETIMKEVEI
jgi:hydroxymethylpyrimidine pyrophosphatase-like HAD family hydrolase